METGILIQQDITH